MARQPTAREFSRAYNACTTAYRNRLRRASLKPGDPFDSAAPRLDISAIPGIVACWDASYAPATASSSGGFLPALGDRVGNRNWGTNQTPWVGSIGEIALFSNIPTLEQRSTLRADFMNHWQLA